MLPAVEGAHALRVLRLGVGDEIRVVDGRGTVYTCRIEGSDARHDVPVAIVGEHRQEPVWPAAVNVMVAPTKHLDRMEWLVEKLVEIGVDAIVPVRCDRSERRDIKVERLERIAVSAMKQSLKAVLPRVLPMTPLKEALAMFDTPQRFVGYCDDDAPQARRLLARELQPGLATTVLIGPEGDFTPAEVAQAFAAGYVPVTMGDNRLRTETAALVACDTFHVINQISN